MSKQMENGSANVDLLELEKFSQLAHRWWDPTSEFRPLHEINPLRLEWINARAPLAGKKVIDIGCGGGILSESWRAGRQRDRHRPVEKALKVADLHGLESGVEVRYKQIAAEDMARKNPASTTSSPAWKCWSTCPTRRRSCAPPPPW